MSKDIAVAGKQFFYHDGSCVKPRGRVCALSQALDARDISPTSDSKFRFRMFMKNIIAWTNIRKGSKVGYFDTEDEEFNTNIEALLTGFTITKLPAWYEPEGSSTVNNSTYDDVDLYLLFPSYNAKKGTHMPDGLQEFIINQVKNNSVGLVTCEWFHYLQSINNDDKRSFSFHGDGTILGQDRDATKGLFTISPFAFEDFAILANPVRTYFKADFIEDDIHSHLPTRWFQTHTTGQARLTPGYPAERTRITSLQPEVTVAVGEVGFSEVNYRFFVIDREEDEVVTTSTTTAAPVSPDIKFKVAEISQEKSCGPMKRTLVGQHANLFELEGDDLYLIKRPNSRSNYKIKVKYEDLMSPKRFDDFYKAITVPIRECGTPLSEPLGDYSTGWYYQPGTTCRHLDESLASTLPTEYYNVFGEGTVETPFVVELGGRDCDQNLVWVQVNQAGNLSFEMTASTDCQDNDPNVYCEPNGQFNKANCDFGTLHLISGVNIYPKQHSSSVAGLSSSTFNFPFGSTVKPIIDEGVAGRSVVRTGSEPFVINFDPESNVKVFILVGYVKDASISLLDDKITTKLLLGTTSPPDPVLEEFTALVINRVPQMDLAGHNRDRKIMTFKMRAGNEVSDGNSDPLTSHINDLDIGLSITLGYRLVEDPLYTIIPSNSPITVTKNATDNKKAAINPFTMPTGGGSATIYIDGEVEEIPTTTPPPIFTYSLVFKNFAATTKFVYKDVVINPGEQKTVSFSARAGEGSTKDQNSCNADFLTYQVVNLDGSLDQSREYRDADSGSNFPYVSVTDSTFAEPITNSNVSCSTADILTGTYNSNPFKYCQDNDKAFNITDGISVSYGRSCSSFVDPFPIRISIPDIPDGGGVTYIRIDGLPVATTPPPPTTSPPTTAPPPPPPCDDLIIVQCVQSLDCDPDGDNCVEDLSNSTNTLNYVTCCPDFTYSDIITRVYEETIGEPVGSKTVSEMETDLENHFSSSCPAIPTQAFGFCEGQNDNGSCSTQIFIRTVDAVKCHDSSSMNPLP